jgi:hypothetical protein
LAKSALEAGEIDAFINGGNYNSARWAPGLPIELWVRPEDVERANEILGGEETISN